MTEEELNMQKQNRDYIKESQDFLNETVSITSKLSDQIQFQVNSVRDKMNLDHEVLKISKENYKAISNLKTDYQDLKKLSSDREKIERQIQKNLTIAGAYAKDITKDQKAAASETLKRIAANKTLQQQANALHKTMRFAKALGEKTNIDDFIKLKNTKESIKLNNHIIKQKEDMTTPEAMSAVLLEKQNEQLEKSLDYLDEEEDAINRMAKAQIYFNATFGALGGLLDKMGMGSVTEILGIKEGQKAAADMADKLTKGGEKSLGVFGKLRVLAAGMGPMFKKIFNPLTVGIGIFNFMVKKFKEGDQLLKTLSAHTKTLAKGLGMSTKSAKHLEHEFASIAGKTGQMPEAIAETTSKMMNLVGTTKNFGKEQVSFFNQLVENGGYSVENATELLKISELQGKSSKELSNEYAVQVLALNNQNNTSVSVKSVMEGIANTSARVRANLKAQGKSLATAAFEAKKMGLELDRVNEIGKSTLDFEGSLTKELEAELLMGKDINLEKMRSAALAGDDVTVAKELNRLIKENGKDLEGNILGQEAFAGALGISTDEYAKIREQQELLSGSGFKDMNEAQNKFNKLIEGGMSIEQAKAKMGKSALTDQLASVSYAQRLEQQERRKQAEAAKFAKNMQPLVKMFREIAEKWSKLLLDNVGRLVPVVNAVGKLFSTIVLKVIGGASDMSATIGDKIEGISKFLVGIIDQGTAWVADGGINRFFETVKDTAKGIWKAIQPVIDFFKSKTGMSVLAGIGGVIGIQKVGESVGLDPLKMAKEVGGGVFNTLKTKLFPKLGVLGSSAAKPMFVQEIGGGGGGMQDQMMDMISGKMGGRKAGIGGGFKKGFKGLMSYAKMAFSKGRAGKVGRARLLRAGKGLLTGQGASFVGGASKGASGAGKVAGMASKVGKLAGVGKLAVGGLGAVAGIAAEAAFAHFASKATEAANAIEGQIIATDDVTEIAGLEAKQKKEYMKADGFAAAGTVAKYTAMGASIGSMIPVVGTAVGAIVGFVAGAYVATVNYKKEQKWRASDAAKFQRKQQRAAAKIAKYDAQATLDGVKLKLKGIKASEAEQERVKAQFGDDVKNMDHTSDAFKSLAKSALDAGNITEEQFTAAINGTLSPFDLMNEAATNAGNKIQGMANAALVASGALGAKAEKEALKAAGTSAAQLQAQSDILDVVGGQIDSMTVKLNRQHEDRLSSAGGDYQTASVLSGEYQQDAAKKTRRSIVKNFQDMLGDSVSKADIQAAMKMAGEKMERAGDTTDMNTEAGMQLGLDAILVELRAQQKLVADQARAAGSQAKANATREYDLALDSLYALQESKGIADAALKVAIDEGIKGQELIDLQKAADDLLASTTDKETELSKMLEVDDFIIRPGQPVIKFNKDDLIMGGTSLDGTDNKPQTPSQPSMFGSIFSSIKTKLGEVGPQIATSLDKLSSLIPLDNSNSRVSNEPLPQSNEELKKELQELKEIMSGFVKQMAQVVDRPITIELDGNKVGQALGQNSYRMQ